MNGVPPNVPPSHANQLAHSQTLSPPTSPLRISGHQPRSSMAGTPLRNQSGHVASSMNPGLNMTTGMAPISNMSGMGLNHSSMGGMNGLGNMNLGGQSGYLNSADSIMSLSMSGASGGYGQGASLAFLDNLPSGTSRGLRV